MGVFEWFSRKSNRLIKKAEMLVDAAKIQAMGSYTPILDRIPLVGKIDPSNWDFVLTVAGVFVAATRLNNLHPDTAKEDQAMEVVAAKLSSWHPNAICAFEDCKTLFEREYDRLQAAGHERRFVASDALGIWIFWNLFEHAPESDEECQAVRIIGGMVTAAFFTAL